MKVVAIPTLAEDAIGFADVDATQPAFCIYCTVREVDPDHAPYCGTFCAIDAEHEDEEN